MLLVTSVLVPNFIDNSKLQHQHEKLTSGELVNLQSSYQLKLTSHKLYKGCFKNNFMPFIVSHLIILAT